MQVLRTCTDPATTIPAMRLSAARLLLATAAAVLALVPAAMAEPTPAQTAFTLKLLNDDNTSAGVKKMLKTKSAIVDPHSGFVDVTGDGRQDAVILVSTGGAAGGGALFVFSPHRPAATRADPKPPEGVVRAPAPPPA